jgi:hypothetical protein
MKAQNYTPEEIGDAYGKLIWAQGLVDFVLNAGFDLRPERQAENEGSLLSIFNIIQDYLKAASEIMFDLDAGYESRFTGLWKKAKKENEE